VLRVSPSCVISSIRLERSKTGGRYPPQNPPVTPKTRTPRRPTWRTAKSTLVSFMINILWLMTSSRPCGPGGEAPAQGQHRTTLRWWRIIIICCWPPCRCHVREGDKAASIDTAHTRLRQRQCQPSPTLRVRARWQRKPGLTKQRVYKIMICRWPRWLSTPAGVEKSLVLIYSYRLPGLFCSPATLWVIPPMSASTWQSFFVIANDHCHCLRRLFSMQRQFLWNSYTLRK